MSKQLFEAKTRGTVMSAENTGSSDRLKLRIRIIEGDVQGSSGYYPADVLKRDASVFKKGTHMHLDHMGFWEMMEGSPGKLETLAGFLDSDAIYEKGSDGIEGLYADAIVISQHAQFIKEVAPNIGVSILAAATSDEGISPATGEPTEIITGFVGVLSVDFVTHPGANGRIIQTLESAPNLWPQGLQSGVKFITNHPATESAGENKKGKRPMAELTEETGKALADAVTGLTSVLTAEAAARTDAAEAAKNAPPEDEPFDVVEAVLNLSALLAESGLPAAAHVKVMQAIKSGVKAEDAISAEKTYIESLTAAVAPTKRERQFGEMFVVGETSKAAPDDNAWAKTYGKVRAL